MWPILILVIVYPLIYPIHSANIACQDIRYKYASTGSDVYNVPITPQSGKAEIKAFLEEIFLHSSSPSQRARKLKKAQAEKLVKSNNSKIIYVKLHFWQF